MVHIKEFAVEQWMDKYETTAKYNVAETCCASISVNDLRELSEDKSDPLDFSTKLTYGAIRGSERLRGALAALYSIETPNHLPADNVLVTAGAIQANFLLLYSLVGPGDHVICHYPTYQQLYSVPASLGAEVSLWKSKETDDWKLDTEELKQLIRPNTKLIILNNPQNPTGAVIPQATLEEIVEIARRSSIIIQADEVYRPIFHSIGPVEREFPRSLLSLGYEHTVVTGSMSKAYSLAGIRVGWLASRDRSIVERCASARDYTTISVGQIDDAIASYALAPACIHNLLERNIELAQKNLAILETFIESHRWACDWIKPRAGTTAFVRFSKKGEPVDDTAFCEALQEKTGVMFVPGSLCFGEGEDFKGYVRIGFVCETEVLEQAMKELGSFMNREFENVPMMRSKLEIPLAIAGPALVTVLAYLNAKYSLFYDKLLIKSLIGSTSNASSAARRDQVNHFYVLEKQARDPKTRDRIFLVYNGRSWTFHETYVLVLRYGAWLRNVYGIKPWEVVAMDFMNSSTFVFVWFGLWSIGAVPALINYNLSGKPLTHSIRTSSARLLLVDEDLRKSFPPEQIEVFAAVDFRDGKGPVEVVFFTPEVEAEILQMEPTREDDTVRSGAQLRDMALLIYTSGTTGLPKPAILPWHKVWSSAVLISTWLSMTKDDRMYTCMPLYHSSASILGVMGCLWASSALIIGRKFSARSFWTDVRESNATIIQYVGETMRYLLAVPPVIDPVTGEDLDKKNKVRIALGNGLRPDIWNRVKERFNIPTIAEFYASTEGTSGSFNLSSNDFTAGAIGWNGGLTGLLMGRGIAIVEVDQELQQPWRDHKTGFCKKVPRGEPGELLWALNAADPGEKFGGYFKNSKATEGKIIRDVLRKGDAFFRTGDMIRWDSDGRWYFTDRLGDTFRWKSENVSTSEVSEVLGVHPDVHEVNVYGVALPNHDGRAGCAAIVFQQQSRAEDQSVVIPPSQESLNSLAAHALKNLPRFAAPQFLRVTGEMQATGNNKQQKHVLRTEGVDPSLVAAGDRLYWLQGNQYVPFEPKDWNRLQAGQAKL
ncbi:long-chain fatty acid transporter [Aspergillus heteromorphus CBS 117.55]|uniref:Very long-chain fatty acid transport protein n=1 Tax=Aspergillus heteromorphus CBS 117.55 TaxID=1448321 RepID=A0A317WY11_9EURO|nr:long-chain fatty acid transporter [Aspergillus heteromorphus CBS 117.55]PWY91239.1 long-chain fatty acid transporter [Aspergillus heteromorphus CBS 117.55]